jgi:catechol 2,3-dioxygenase-like lactoylglutathione lyase family enzyme
MSEPDPALRFESGRDVAIHVPDLARARAFYGGVLGFRLILEDADKLAFQTGALTLWVNRDEQVASYIPSFDVPSYERAREHLIANGCRILRESPAEKALYFVDPFGIVADIIEKPEKPAGAADLSKRGDAAPGILL